jgi:hypothetical protein
MRSFFGRFLVSEFFNSHILFHALRVLSAMGMFQHLRRGCSTKFLVEIQPNHREVCENRAAYRCKDKKSPTSFTRMVKPIVPKSADQNTQRRTCHSPGGVP